MPEESMLFENRTDPLDGIDPRIFPNDVLRGSQAEFRICRSDGYRRNTKVFQAMDVLSREWMPLDEISSATLVVDALGNNHIFLELLDRYA